MTTFNVRNIALTAAAIIAPRVRTEVLLFSADQGVFSMSNPKARIPVVVQRCPVLFFAALNGTAIFKPNLDGPHPTVSAPTARPLYDAVFAFPGANDLRSLAEWQQYLDTWGCVIQADWPASQDVQRYAQAIKSGVDMVLAILKDRKRIEAGNAFYVDYREGMEAWIDAEYRRTKAAKSILWEGKVPGQPRSVSQEVGNAEPTPAAPAAPTRRQPRSAKAKKARKARVVA